MSHVLEYTLSLQDKMSAKLKQIGISSDSALTKFAKLEKQSLASTKLMNEMGKSVHTLSDKLNLLRNERDLIPAKNFRDLAKYNAEIKKTEKEISKLQGTSAHSKIGGMFGGMMGAIGIGAGIYGIGSFMESGIEKAHELHQAEAQVKASLESTAHAAGLAYEDMEKSAKKLSSTTLYSRIQIMDMQSMLLTFPSVSKKTFEAAETAILNMSTKMHQDVKQSTIEVGKALQDPKYGVMALRRVGVNLTREQSKIIQNLVESGHKDLAQKMILKELNVEFGGSAEAAFNADPVARYNKIIGAAKVTMGEAAIKVQAALAPAMVKLANIFSSIVGVVAPVVVWFTKHKWAVITLGSAITVLTVALEWNTIVTKLNAGWQSILTFGKTIGTAATKVATAAQIDLNMAVLANPYVLAAAAIIAMGVAIYAVTHKSSQFSKSMDEIAKKTGDYAAEETSKLDTLFIALKQTNSGSEERIKLAKELRDLYPDILKNINLEKGDINELAKGYELVANNIKKKARMQASQEELVSLYKDANKQKKEVDTYKYLQDHASTKLTGWNYGNYVKYYQGKLDDVNKAINKISNDAAKDKISELTGPDKPNTNKKDKSPIDIPDNITGGGSKPTNITINLGKLMDAVHIHSQTLKEGAQEMEKVVTEVMLRVLNSGNAVAGR